MPPAGFTSRTSHLLGEHVIAFSLLASSDGLLQVCTHILLSSSLYGLAQEGRGGVQLLVHDDGGIFPGVKCIIPLVLLCLLSKSTTTVCYRAERRLEQKCNRVLSACCAGGEMNATSLACVPTHFSTLVCTFKGF